MPRVRMDPGRIALNALGHRSTTIRVQKKSKPNLMQSPSQLLWITLALGHHL